MRVIDTDFSDILLDEKSYKTQENILIYNISYKTFMSAKPLRIGLIKQMDLLTFMMELGIQYYMLLKDILIQSCIHSGN